MEEEVVLLEEQLATAHADIERLEARLAAAEEGEAGRESETSELRRELTAAQAALAEREARIDGLTTEVAEARSRLDELEAQVRADAARYRELVLAREPELPAELIVGDSVDAIEEALARARQTVARVRQHLDQQAQSLRIPTGAPVRAAPDASGLSAPEKIRFGLQQS